MTSSIIEVRDLQKYFPVTKGLLISKTVGWVKAVDGVSFSVQAGETFALVGESGCGKTTTAKLLLRLEQPTSGEILFRGKNVGTLSNQEDRLYRKSVQAVFQDPWSSLDPRQRVGSIVAEPLVLTNHRVSRAEVARAVAEVLESVGLSAEAVQRFPHEFSGGQRQRIAVARTLVVRPSLVTLDEPASALDVSFRAQVMNLLKDLQEQYGIAYFLISHHLTTVAYLSHWVGVMYLGRLVELAPTRDLFSNPCHPYTKALLSAALPTHPRTVQKEIILEGEVPSAQNLPSGCRFHTRCPSVMARCNHEDPANRQVAPQHAVACHLY